MALPWSEKEIEDELGTLDREGVMKVFATLIFSRPDLLKHLPDLTEKLLGVANVSSRNDQADIFNWIEVSFSKVSLEGKCAGPRRIQPNVQPVSPKADVIVKDEWAEHMAKAASSHSQFDNLRANRRVSGVDGKMVAGVPVGISHPVPDDVPACFLQFSTDIYYAKEGEDQEMVVDVIRLGSDDQRVTCRFHTQDTDGKDGERYKAVSGELIFEPGEIMKEVRIPIIDSPSWSASLEFRVILSEPTGHCALGRYLYMCRVKVIDPDCFPTNKYADAIRSDLSSVGGFGLLWEYFKFNYHSSPIVCRRSKHQFLCDQLANLYFVFKLYVGKVMIDKVLRVYDPKEPTKGCGPGGYVFLGAIVACPTNEDPDDASHLDFKMKMLFICALLIFIPQFFIHYSDFKQVFFKIGGTSRKTLQGNLVRKFLNYDDAGRSQLGASDLVMAMTRDTQMLVRDGYMQIFPLMANIGKLVMMAILQLSIGAYVAVLPVVLYAICLLPFLYYRHPISSISSHEQDAAQNDLTNYVTEIMTTYQLICDYVMRPVAVELIEAKIGTFNKKMMAADAVNFNNRYMCKWLSLLCIAAWLVNGGHMVLSGDSELGIFVTNLAIFNDVGQAWTAIFETMLKMEGAMPYLQKIVRYMNLPIDLEPRMRLNRRRRAAGETARMSVRKSLSKSLSNDELQDPGGVAGSVVARTPTGTQHTVFAADLVPIAVEGLAYAYESPLKMHRRMQLVHSHHPSANRAPVAIIGEEDEGARGSIQNCSFSFAQGSFITLVGLSGHGKSTLMRLLGSQIVPDSGDLLIPPHLRTLHISPQPTFFYDTLHANLTYGVHKNNTEDASIERVMAVLTQLKVPKILHQYLDPSNRELFDVKVSWSTVLSTTQLGLLSLARAFIANPEVLVLHKPTVFFDDATATNIYICLNDFIVQRGFCMDPAKVAYRRPRTCIITATRPQGVEAADEVFRVTPENTVPIRRQLVSTDMLK